MGRELHVKIGQILRGEHGDVLKSTFGSCVGIAVLWPRLRIYALAHCLLADAPAGADLSGAKYVSAAVPNLLLCLGAERRECRELEIVVVGGGRMLGEATHGAAGFVGDANVEAARRHLASAGLTRVKWDVGGDQATKITVDCSTGEVSVRRVTKLEDGEGGRVAS